MTVRLCKYGCGTTLEGFDEEQRKFLEAGSGGLHTKERCQEAKAKKEQKDDHGNEETMGQKILQQEVTRQAESPKEMYERYVDHTQQKQQRFIAFSSTGAQSLTKMVDDWIDQNNEFMRVKLIGQLQLDNGVFAIALYYEEI